MTSQRLWLLAVIFAAAALPVPAAGTEIVPYRFEWERNMGVGGNDGWASVSADPVGNVYLAGYTDGNLAGPNAGDFDAVISRYDESGGVLWSRQLGGSASDQALGVAHDALGNVYVTGRTGSSLAGTSAGDFDAFVAKLDPDGAVSWLHQFGTPAADEGFGVAVDPLGNVYVSGVTRGVLGDANAGEQDVFLSKFDSSGATLWTRQFGSETIDYNRDVAVDALGNAYLPSTTGYGNALGALTKVSPNGDLSWSQDVLGSVICVDVDADGNPVVGGTSPIDLAPHRGNGGPYVSKFDASGAVLWTNQFSTYLYGTTQGIASDGEGRNWALVGWGLELLTYDEGGQEQLNDYQNFPIASDEVQFPTDVATGSPGNVYVVGRSVVFRGDQSGMGRAFVLRLARVPEPPASALAAMLALGAVWRRRVPSR